jgi:hypothetical protein
LADHWNPLLRDRAILVDVFQQLTLLAEMYESAGWDPAPYQAEAKRIHLRLIVVQMRIEEGDLD